MSLDTNCSMAGFAVVMTILTFAFVGLVIACGMSVALYVAARRRVRRGVNRRKAIFVGTAAPFLGLLWIAVAFVAHVEISNRLAHQDCGLSGDPYVTLPNGYVLGSLNTYDGYFKAPGYETDVPVAGPGYVRLIIHLKFADPYFIGTQFDFDTASVRSFVFDTRTREFHASEPENKVKRAFNSSNKADVDAWTDANNHAQLDSDSYWTLYRRYRHRWPNYVFLAILIAGEAGIAFCVWKSWKARPNES